MPEPTQPVQAAPEPAAVTTAPPVLSPQQVRERDLIEEYTVEDPSTKAPLVVPPVVASTPAQSIPPAPAVQPKPQHSRRALQMAHDFGIPQEEIDATTPDELDSVVYNLNRQFLSRAREASQANPQPQQMAQPPRPAEDTIDWGEGDDGNGGKMKFTDADVHPALANVIKGLVSKIKGLEQALGGINQRDQAREVETTADLIDRHFAGQDVTMFGKGSWRELNGKAEYDRRAAIVRKATELAGPNATRDQQLAKLQEAQQRLYPNAVSTPPEPVKPAPAARDPQNGRFTPQQQAWINAGIARPTQRGNAEEPKGVQRAANALRAKMDEAGIDADDGMDGVARELNDELPD